MHEPYSLIVGEVSTRSQLELLENLRLSPSEAWIGVSLGKVDSDLLHQALNSSRLRFILNENSVNELQRVLQEQKLHHRRNWLLREYYQRNKNLESLTADLEKIVVERTLHLEQSNKDQSEKIQMERGLIRFIKEIALQPSVEDVLTLLRRDNRKFHNVGEPILLLQYGKTQQVFHFRSGQVHKFFVDKPFQMMPPRQLSPADASKELANILARPFAKAALFPLSLNMLTHFQEAPAMALLCFEHSMGQVSKEFEDYINERVNPVGITLDRILLEQELDAFSYRWEKTFDGIRDPVAIIDVQYDVLRSNRKFVNSQEGQYCYEVFAGRTDFCPGCPLSQTIQTGRPQFGEVKAADRTYQVWSYPIRLVENEKPTSFVHQYVDVTESRDLQAKMLQHEKMVAIGTLAGHIAHELNNPLTGIRSLAQVLVQDTQEEQSRKDFEEIEKAAGRCQRIIKNLLEFTQDEKVETELISLDEIVERTLPMLKTALRSHRLHLDLKTRSHKISTYSHLLQQVVFNLVHNACQAMVESGEVSLLTEVDPVSRDLLLRIKDTGPGIPVDIQGRIFDAFFTTKNPGQGTGLGLSISKTIVEKCGGQISLAFSDKNGSEFLLRFEAP